MTTLHLVRLCMACQAPIDANADHDLCASCRMERYRDANACAGERVQPRCGARWTCGLLCRPRTCGRIGS